MNSLSTEKNTIGQIADQLEDNILALSDYFDLIKHLDEDIILYKLKKVMKGTFPPLVGLKLLQKNLEFMSRRPVLVPNQPITTLQTILEEVRSSMMPLFVDQNISLNINMDRYKEKRVSVNATCIHLALCNLLMMILKKKWADTAISIKIEKVEKYYVIKVVTDESIQVRSIKTTLEYQLIKQCMRLCKGKMIQPTPTYPKEIGVMIPIR